MSLPPVSPLPLLAVLIAAVLSAVLIVLLMPLLRRYALARPNARSSHAVPTPQGGGVAIIAGTVVVSTALLIAETKALPSSEAVVLILSVLALTIVGGRDDVRPLRVSIRLGLQIAAVAAVVIATGGRLFPAMPLVLERGIEVLAGLWFVNLINFTDGLDWMTLAGMVPLTIVLVLLGCAGLLPLLPTLVAAALLGGFLGFAPFNRPVARLFMGDVGSLPVGLLVAWLLYRLALEGGFAAALLLPLYPVADATLTLLWRLKRGEKVWQAHRSHFYQVATVNGFSVPEVVGSVFAVSVVLAVLAAVSLLWPSWAATVAVLIVGCGLVALLLPAPVQYAACGLRGGTEREKDIFVLSGPLIALTGATGFIGRHLLTALSARGFRVRVLLRRPVGVPEGASSAVVGDLARPINMAAALSGVDAVVHSAGLAHAMSGAPEDDFRSSNTEATKRLAEAAQRAKVRRFVFLSSIRAQTGPSAPAPIIETAPPAPTDAYGRSKLAAEQALAEIGLDWVALRPVLVYGAGVKGNMAVLVRLARSPYPLPLASLSGRRSLVSVESLSAAVATVLQVPGPLSRPLIVADPDPLNLPEMIAALRSGLDRRAGLLPMPSSLIGLACRMTGREEVFDRLSGSLVAQAGGLSALGWQPAQSSRDGLAELTRDRQTA